MLITSKHAATLVGASTPIAKNAEFQTELEENGVFKRHILKSIDLPAGKVVNLSASGEHLILSGLSAELKAGGHIPLTLTFKLADKELVKVEVQVDVRASHHHHHITYEPSK
jgi:copper(I)-binding protein